MKYSQYLVLVLICSWLFSGTGFTEPAGDNRQLQYNDNGVAAGAELYYSKQNQALDIFGGLTVKDRLTIGNETTSSTLVIAPMPFYPSPVFVFYNNGVISVPVMDISSNKLRLLSQSVSVYNKLGIFVDDPQATLDINGYAKLKSYSKQPVPCTLSRRGTIVMNGNYDCAYAGLFPVIPFPSQHRLLD